MDEIQKHQLETAIDSLEAQATRLLQVARQTGSAEDREMLRHLGHELHSSVAVIRKILVNEK